MGEFTLTFGKFLIYLAVMVGVTYLLRLLPMLFIRKRITNRFIRSVLYYIPYSVLAVMTVPAIFYVSDNIVAGILASVVAVALAYFGKSLIFVALSSATTVLAVEIVYQFILN